MDTPKILIVDDNKLNLELIEFLLNVQGYQISKAYNATEVLAMLGFERPDLILMDLQLPGIDGFELTKMLKSDPKYSDIPIIAITAYAMAGDKEKAMNAGCDGYLAKPIDTRKLPEIINQYLQTNKTS